MPSVHLSPPTFALALTASFTDISVAHCPSPPCSPPISSVRVDIASPRPLSPLLLMRRLPLHFPPCHTQFRCQYNPSTRPTSLFPCPPIRRPCRLCILTPLALCTLPLLLQFPLQPLPFRPLSPDPTVNNACRLCPCLEGPLHNKYNIYVYISIFLCSTSLSLHVGADWCKVQMLGADVESGLSDVSSCSPNRLAF